MPNFKTIFKFPIEKIETEIQPNQHYHSKKTRWLVGSSPCWLAVCPSLNFTSKSMDTTKGYVTLKCGTNIFTECFIMAYPGLQLYNVLHALQYFCLYHGTDSVTFVSTVSIRGTGCNCSGTIYVSPDEHIMEFVSSNSKSNGYLQSGDKSSLKFNDSTLTATEKI